jgi:hypothetical protein
MTKEQLIELLNGNLWVSGQTDNFQTVMGVERAAEKIATKFFLMEAEIERLRKHNTEMGWRLNPDRMGGQFSEWEINRRGDEWS